MATKPDLTAYDYRSFILVAFPNGLTFVKHAALGETTTPHSPTQHEAQSLGDAMTWVDAYMD